MNILLKFAQGIIHKHSLTTLSLLNHKFTTKQNLPQNPRAIYFSDDIYLGYVPGGQIEVIGIDPKLRSNPIYLQYTEKSGFRASAYS